MDHYTIMFMPDARSPVRRFQLAKSTVRRAAIAFAMALTVLAVATWDYTRLRADNAELDALRIEVAEQREQVEIFERALARAESELGSVRELERKVRIIANLPGAAGVGGDDISELVPPARLDKNGEIDPMPPAGVPVDFGTPVPTQRAEGDATAERAQMGAATRRREGLTTDGAWKLYGMRRQAGSLRDRAGQRGESLEALVGELEAKRHQLASMPSVWPARGWLTSRFGPRISPFTARRQQHTGIDIAAALGTPIAAPARGRVSSISSSGPLGNSLTIDHGFGVRTFYGHTEEIFVGVGDLVERGQKLASIGSSGRSTGPHLHYSIQVRGKARDPLNYIFD